MACFIVSGVAGMTGLLAACGGNSNTSSAETGYTTSNLNVMAAVNTATVSGLWKTNALGECSINTDYCTAYETSEVDGVQTISIKLNPQAKFNDGLLGTVNNGYLSGPYKVDNWGSAQKVLTVMPNENWWGEKPLLDRITFRQMEASAARPYADPSAYINAGWVKE